MKANERKELEHNILLTHLNRWIEKLKGNTLYFIVASVVLLVLVILLARFWIRSGAAAKSARYTELVRAKTIKELDEIIASNAKETALWAKLEKARLQLYREGIEKLGTNDFEELKKAYAKVEDGRKLYLDTVNDLKDYPSLQQETWISCAKAEEVLLGVPKEDKNNEYRGSFDKMLEYYRNAAAINPDSEASKSYAAEAKKLESQRTQIEDFYRDIYRFASMAKMPFPPPPPLEK